MINMEEIDRKRLAAAIGTAIAFSEHQNRQKAAAAAVAAALSLGGTLSISQPAITPDISVLSPWQTVMRANILQSKNRGSLR